MARSTLSLLVALAGSAGARLEVVVRAQLDQARVEVHGAALALEHRGLEVVVEKHPRRHRRRSRRRPRGPGRSSPGSGRRRIPGRAPASRLSVITKHDSRRRARPTVTSPKCAQSTWACSPAKTRRRRNGSQKRGRNRATRRRTMEALPWNPRTRSMSNSRVDTSRGCRRNVSSRKGT